MKVGSFTQEEEPNRNRFTGGTSFVLRAGADGDECDRSGFLWRVHALAKAGLSIAELGFDLIRAGYTCKRSKYWTLEGIFERLQKVAGQSGKRSGIMRLVETLKSKTGALKVAEIARLLGVTPQHIYRMAASGSIPSFRVLGSVRFDPDEVAAWLERKQNASVTVGRINSGRAAA
jgi:excisionase family DNA binding protein